MMKPLVLIPRALLCMAGLSCSQTARPKIGAEEAGVGRRVCNRSGDPFLYSLARTLVGTCLLLSSLVGRAGAQPLSVSADIPEALNRFDPIYLELNRRPETSDGRLAIFLNDTDFTALFELDGASLRYASDLLPLPSGEAELVVYLLGEDASWDELGRFPLTVRTRGNFDRALLTPSFTLNNKGQVVEGQYPEPDQQIEHRIYQDFSGRFGLQGELARADWSADANVNVLGVSYQNEALRFGDLGENAPRVDLSDYLLQAQRGSVQLQLGHVMHGRQRHLIDSFGSRGTVVSASWHDRVDVSLAAMNGSQIVGWSNPLGLNEPDHRMLSATAGITLLQAPAARFRVETSYLNGSVLPFTGFNQAAVVDAEESRGGGVRGTAEFFGRRVNVDVGFAGSRYVNPQDPQLELGADLVPVLPETKYARYLEASAAVLQDVQFSPRLVGNLRLAYRREHVDPLYQSAAAYVRPDLLQDVFEVQGGLGPLSAQVALHRSEDNLDDIPSILKTKTRQHSVRLGFAPTSLLGFAARAKVGPLIPVLSYSYDRTHQYGAFLPVGGGFSPSHVPDQMNHLHNGSIEWQGNEWRIGYRFASSYQDNRQEDREEDDFLNRTHGFSIGVRPVSRLDLGLDVNLDRAENRGGDETDRTRRFGFQARVQPVQRLNLSAFYSPTRLTNLRGTKERLDNSLRLEGAYSLSFADLRRMPVRAQVFIRYARQTAQFRDLTFDLDTDNRSWTVNTGISLSFF